MKEFTRPSMADFRFFSVLPIFVTSPFDKGGLRGIFSAQIKHRDLHKKHDAPLAEFK